MATVTTPVRSRNLAEAHQRVRSPLERLRTYIRLYVSLEGAALVGQYLALWFWIGLIFDYGIFRLFHIDWVQELPWGVRCGVLLVLLSVAASAQDKPRVTKSALQGPWSSASAVVDRPDGPPSEICGHVPTYDDPEQVVTVLRARSAIT